MDQSHSSQPDNPGNMGHNLIPWSLPSFTFDSLYSFTKQIIFEIKALIGYEL